VNVFPQTSSHLGKETSGKRGKKSIQCVWVEGVKTRVPFIEAMRRSEAQRNECEDSFGTRGISGAPSEGMRTREEGVCSLTKNCKVVTKKENGTCDLKSRQPERGKEAENLH